MAALGEIEWKDIWNPDMAKEIYITASLRAFMLLAYSKCRMDDSP